jgi:TetR/AcrR family transcriptional regulator
MARRIPGAKKVATTGRPAQLKRAEQPRAQETPSAILQAALSEFANKGYDAASIRNIAERIGLQHPLITYRYRTKEVLWQAVAEHVFARIREEWDTHLADSGAMSPEERLRLAGYYRRCPTRKTEVRCQKSSRFFSII